jgi:hypothetical protein
MTSFLLVYYASILSPTLPGNLRIDVPLVILLLLKKLFDHNLRLYKVQYLVLPPFILFFTVSSCIIVQFALGKISFVQGLPSIWGYGKILLFSLFYSSQLQNISLSIGTNLGRLQVLNRILYLIVACAALSGFMLLLPDYAGPINLIFRGSLENTANTYSISRPVSVFDSVHACAYFSALTLVFCSIYKNTYRLYSCTSSGFIPNKVYLYINLSAFLGLFLTSSKSGLLSVIAFYLSQRPIVLSRLRTTLSYSFILTALAMASLSVIFSEKLSAILISISLSLSSLVAALANNLSTTEVSDSFSGRLNHGWANAIHNFSENPLFGSVNIIQFIGDGGYTELLSNYGIVGLSGFILYLFLTIRCFHSLRLRVGFLFVCLILTIPTGLFQRRVSEVLPFYLSLYLAVYVSGNTNTSGATKSIACSSSIPGSTLT